ncbi:MAG: hypothetical protein ABSB09_03445 [Acidimicrobiales bacterium]|jgi:hypothetical protein
MKRTLKLAALAGAVATVTALCLPSVAGADGLPNAPFRSDAPVYVQTNDPTGNQVVTYLPDARGGLVEVGRTDTGGFGVAVPGAVVDKLASQGGLAADPADGLLVAVNGGSNTISVFHAFGGRLSAPRVVPSGGTTPVSVAVRGDAIYVLNGGGTGSIQGYFADSLTPIPGSNRSLGLTPGLTPAFLNTPGQIGFTPDGRQLVVTTKANGSDIDVFNLNWFGGVSGGPVVNPSATPVPFGFTFDHSGDLVVTEAGTSALTTYSVAGSGTITELGSTTDGLAALCWVATNGTYFFGDNAGSADVTSYTVGADGTPKIVANTTTDAGPIDLTTSPDGRSLYVETGGSDLVDTFAVQPDGSLVSTGSVAPELPGHTGLEGIAVGGSW